MWHSVKLGVKPQQAFGVVWSIFWPYYGICVLLEIAKVLFLGSRMQFGVVWRQFLPFYGIFGLFGNSKNALLMLQGPSAVITAKM